MGTLDAYAEKGPVIVNSCAAGPPAVIYMQNRALGTTQEKSFFFGPRMPDPC